MKQLILGMIIGASIGVACSTWALKLWFIAIPRNNAPGYTETVDGLVFQWRPIRVAGPGDK